MNHNHPEDDQRHASDLQECSDEIKALRAALGASTELLRECGTPIDSPSSWLLCVRDQIAANEAALKGGG